MKSCLVPIGFTPTQPPRKGPGIWDWRNGFTWLPMASDQTFQIRSPEKNKINAQSWVNTIKVAPSFNVFAGFCSDLKFCHLYNIKVCFSPCFSCSIFSGRTSTNYLIVYKLFHFSTMDGVSANWNPLKFTEKHPPTACEAAAQQVKHLRLVFQIIISSLRKFHTKTKTTIIFFRPHLFTNLFFVAPSILGAKTFSHLPTTQVFNGGQPPRWTNLRHATSPLFFHAGIDTAWNAVMASGIVGIDVPGVFRDENVWNDLCHIKG